LSPIDVKEQREGGLMSHRIMHIELPADDPAAAGAFYAKVFGWTVTLDPRFDYLEFVAAGGPPGAFVKIGPGSGGTPPVQRNRPLLYLSSDDIDGDLARIVTQGGEVVTPRTAIPGVGHFAIFRDPGGNIVGLLTFDAGQAS
jgi:predicted enzyme related to lactoylglutathione lyase